MASPAQDVGKGLVLFLIPKDIPDAYQARLKQKYPGLTIRWRNVLTDTGLLSSSDLPKELFSGVTIICCHIMLIPDASLVPDCHLVQLSAAGPDKAIKTALYNKPDVAFCTSNGIHAPQIAEWVIAAWLSFQHQFPRYAAQQQQSYWPTQRERATAYVEDSSGLRMGILGYGAIGRQRARLAKALDDSYCVPGTGDPDGLIPSAWFHGSSRDSVNDFLGRDLDVLVMCLPLTELTKGVISEDQFEILSQKKTFVINVGRGPHIKTDALMSALEDGKIRGAALDVTDPEPLPQAHPLWKAPNVFITPHVSWQTPHYFTRVMGIVEQNLERLSKGERLMNQVDKDLHY